MLVPFEEKGVELQLAFKDMDGILSAPLSEKAVANNYVINICAYLLQKDSSMLNQSLKFMLALFSSFLLVNISVIYYILSLN